MATHPDPATRAVYDAADRMRAECLRADGSLFTPGRPIWNASSAADLRERFNKQPDFSDRTFIDKFADQLAGAPAETIQLAAELIYVHFLIASDIGGAAKRRLINQVLSWSSTPVAIPRDLAEALDRGLAATGVAFKTYRPAQLWFLIDFLALWKALPSAEQQTLLDDPWEFKKFLQQVPLTSAYAQFNALLHLVHPQTFESIVSRDHKEQIATAFAAHAGERDDVDVRLLTARHALASQYGADLNWYAPGLAELWQRVPTPPTEPSTEPAASVSNPIRDRFMTFLDGWLEARQSPLKGHPIQLTMRELRERLAEGAGVSETTFAVESSVGAGNWAQVPWIAFLHRQETTSTQQGTYPVYLFRADGTGVYLTLAQGVTRAIQEGGRVRAREQMALRARRVRDLLEASLPSFNFDLPVDLRGTTVLASTYEDSVIASRFYPSDSLPDDEELTADLSELVGAYTSFIEGRVRQRQSWLVPVAPDNALPTGGDLTLSGVQSTDAIAVGDEVLLWRNDDEPSLGAIARVERTTPLPSDLDIGTDSHALTSTLALFVEEALAEPISPQELGRLGLVNLPDLGSRSIQEMPAHVADLVRQRVRAGVPLLVGAASNAEADAGTYRDRVSQQGRAAMWWSFLLTAEKEAALQSHPFIYIYQGLPTQALLYRARIREWQTQPGSSGLECPWPTFAPAELRGRTSAGPTQAELFKTWFLIDRVERVEPALGLSDLERVDGQPMNPSGLVGGFQLWRRRSENVSSSLDELASATHMPRAQLEELEALTREKKQVIFSGPPGSGKTYVAGKFARYLTGNPLDGTTDHRVALVQFHQSYGYEDFVQGIRPETDEAGTLRYEVRPGVFKVLCERAAADPQHTYVVVIDEINRGNISRILGELLLVLEYRNEQVQLAYSPPNAAPFSVPPNVIVLGTMNTADRSLAQIDYALRRRFYFFPVLPIVGDDAPVLRSWLAEHDLDATQQAQVLKLFIELNRRVRDELDEHFHIGHSYLMRPGIASVEVQAQVWRHAILPLLEEYFYNHPRRHELLQQFQPTSLLAEPVANLES